MSNIKESAAPPKVISTETEIKQPVDTKTILLAILARNKAHILPHFLKCIDALEYDKKLITVYVDTNNNCDLTEYILDLWISARQKDYKHVEINKHEIKEIESETTNPHTWTTKRFKNLGEIRNKSLQKAIEHKCDYYFVVDCDNLITPETLRTLVNEDKPYIAPMLTEVPDEKDYYSNYFCDVDERGYYKHSDDYYDILYRRKIGTFEVPVAHCTYLIKTEYLSKLSYVDETNRYEFVIFSDSARKNGVKQYICNKLNFGVLVLTGTDASLCDEANEVNKYFLTTKT